MTDDKIEEHLKNLAGLAELGIKPQYYSPHSKPAEGPCLEPLKKPGQEADVGALLQSLFVQSQETKWQYFAGNPAEVVPIWQKQFAITKADDPCPVLATFGLGPCVALVGYEPVAKVGFMAHYSGVKQTQSFPELLCKLYQLGLQNDTARFGVRLIGGQTGDSEQLVDKLRQLVTKGTLFYMSIVEEDVLGVMQSRSVALDTRTGELFHYDPKTNPLMKPRTAVDDLAACCDGPAQLIYCPKIN